MDLALRQLDKRLRNLERNAVRVRIGEVTSTSPLSVAVGGSTDSFVGVSTIATGLSVGNVVACLTFGSDLLVLGAIS